MPIPLGLSISLNGSATPDTAVMPDGTVPPAKSTPWNTHYVGYFVPNNTDQRHHYCSGGAMYFTSVYAFVNHLRSLQSHISMATIRDNIHFCLRGKAVDWYATELSSKERTDLGILPLEKGCYEKLIEHFHPPRDISRYEYETASYSLEDAEARRDPVEWAHNILRHAQAIGYTDTYSQLDHIFHALDTQPLEWGIPYPESVASVSDFMADLNMGYSAWCHGQDNPDAVSSPTDSPPSSPWFLFFVLNVKILRLRHRACEFDLVVWTGIS